MSGHIGSGDENAGLSQLSPQSWMPAVGGTRSGLNEKYPLEGLVFGKLVLSWWYCLGKVMEPLGGVALLEEERHWGGSEGLQVCLASSLSSLLCVFRR